MDVSSFINKATVDTKAEEFIPKHQFVDFAIEPKLKEAIVSKGYVTPTAIQDQSIPHILSGSDIVGIANTGTGKTGAFLIPLINKMILNKAERALVLAPTRELALQIEKEFRGFTTGMQLYSISCVGGANIGPQISSLKHKPSLVVGTPGRLKDLLERKALILSDFKTVVLDEADRMLDMGFIHDMRTILSKLAPERQTLFFSATLSPEIEKLIGEFLKNPVRVSVKTQETSLSIEQDIIQISADKTKIDTLRDLLVQPAFHKVLIFGRTKHGVEKLSKTLVGHGFTCESIHGNKTHGRRQKALELFKQSKVQVLCATDVAARGLDIDNVSHVINYDLPTSREDYVHRIGRTGRGGKRGKALTFID